MTKRQKLNHLRVSRQNLMLGVRRQVLGVIFLWVFPRDVIKR